MTRTLRAAALMAALMIGTAVTAGAQGGPPGGGQRRAPDAMAMLERPLTGIDGLSQTQKDSLTKIETVYREKMTAASNAMREQMMAARAAGTPPDMAAMMKAREGMQAIRTEEFGLARAVLNASQQAKWDANVKEMLAAEAEQQAQMRQRMGQPPM